MAAPPDPDATWLHFIQAGYYDDTPGPACLYCNPNPVRTEEGDLEDTGTSAAPPNTGSPNSGSPNSGSPSRGRKKKRKQKTKEKTGKECKRFFCVPCKQGGLCVNEFNTEGRPHFDHPRLQIFRTSYENSVRKDDMVHFLDTTSVMGICSNDHTVHHLSTRKASTAMANVMHCQGCRKKVATAKSYRNREENARDARVCSIQCLLVCRARNRPVNYRNENQRKQGTPMRSPVQ